jgi:hypothetical protein
MRVASRRGLPLIVPGRLRLLIEGRDFVTIKAVGSLLSVFRVIKASPKLNLDTIVSGFSGTSAVMAEWEVENVFRKLKRNFGSLKISKAHHLLPLTTAGPNSRISIRGATADACALVGSPVEGFWRVVSAEFAPALTDMLEKEVGFLHAWFQFIGLKFPASLTQFWQMFKLGKLCQKFEAAGKVRIFAVTDVWTQSILHPLHEALFALLRKIPQDGTFDQLKPLQVLIDKGHKDFWSYDLSAATDRLPIAFQTQILSYFIGKTVAEAWANLLVKRDWWFKGKPIRYAVGQPMGALSSWAMLALTHHFMVQLAARRVLTSVTWFEDYAVLGDDLVIANKAVAEAYLVIARDLGVEINLSKSLESGIGVAEFAKRLLSDAGDLSPASPRLISHLISNVRYLPTVLADLASRGLLISPLKSFLSESPLRKVVKSKPLEWEVWSWLPFDKNSLVTAPFLETDKLNCESGIRALLEASDAVFNRTASDALASAVDQNSTILARLWARHGVTEEDEELSQSELAALREVLNDPDDSNYEITGHEYARVVVTGGDYESDPAKFTGLSLDSDFNVLGQLPSSADLRTVLDSQNSSPRLSELFRRYDYTLEEDVSLTPEWAHKYIVSSLLDLRTAGPTVTDVYQVKVDRPIGLSQYKFWKELEAEVRKRNPEYWDSDVKDQGASMPKMVGPAAKREGMKPH